MREEDNEQWVISEEFRLMDEVVVDAFDEAERAGTGAVSVDGSMVDAPVVKRARGILDLAGRTTPH